MVVHVCEYFVCVVVDWMKSKNFDCSICKHTVVLVEKKKKKWDYYFVFQNNISVCVRRCRVRLALLGNDFEQNVHEYRCLSLFEIDENVDGDDIGVNGR